MNGAIQKIKVTLRRFKNPNPDNYEILGTRINSIVELHLLVLQEARYHFPKTIRKVVFTKDLTDMPSWIDGMNDRIGRYCNVFMLPILFQKPGLVDPIKACCLIGDPDAVNLAEAYVSYIHDSITIHCQAYQRTIKKQLKADRKARRDGKKVEKLGEARELSSNYRIQLVNHIQTMLDNILEELKNNDKDAYYSNMGHRDTLEHKLKSKHGPKWRSVLSRVTLTNG